MRAPLTPAVLSLDVIYVCVDVDVVGSNIHGPDKSLNMRSRDPDSAGFSMPRDVHNNIIL